MRLIDADEFKRQASIVCIKDGLDVTKVSVLLKLIDAQPTAYSVDGVVERLEKNYPFEVYDRYQEGFLCGLETAISIVKGGGI